MRLFEDQSNWLFTKLSSLLIEVFYDLEMSSFVLNEHRLDIAKIFNRVDREYLVEEFNIARRIVLESFLMNLSER